jgi:hypothetical protein
MKNNTQNFIMQFNEQSGKGIGLKRNIKLT